MSPLRLGWQPALRSRPLSLHLPGSVQPESERPRSWGLPARLLVPSPPLLSPGSPHCGCLSVRLGRPCLSPALGALPSVSLPSLFLPLSLPFSGRDSSETSRPPPPPRPAAPLPPPSKLRPAWTLGSAPRTEGTKHSLNPKGWAGGQQAKGRRVLCALYLEHGPWAMCI